jgi:hypothetical protein
MAKEAMLKFLFHKTLETRIHLLTLHWKCAQLIALDPNYITQTIFKHNCYLHILSSGFEPAIPRTKPLQINTSERTDSTL